MAKQNFHKILCSVLLCSSVCSIILLPTFFADFTGTDRFRSALQTTYQQQFSLHTEVHALTEVINKPSADTVLLSSLQELGSGSHKFKGIKHENLLAEDCNGRYVYMYSLPSKFNDFLLRECQNLSVWTNMCPHITNSGLGQPLLQLGEELGDAEAAGSSWFATNQFTAEVIFHERMRHYRCLTPHPSKATAFYVPFYAGFDMSRHVGDHNLTARDQAGIELVKFLRSKSQWKKRGGRDHFMVMGRIAWDFLREQDSPNAWGNKLLLLPEVKNMSSLLIEAHPWRKNQHGIPYPSYFHPRRRSDIERWQKRMRTKRRQILFSFAGAPRPGLDKASIRGHIFKQCSSSPRCKMLRCQQGPSICHNPDEVMKLFTNSVFCLQLQGNSFTRRSIFDSMLAGCIPVFFTEHSAYTQYKWHLPQNRSSYSVYIRKESVQGAGNLSIEQHLLSLTGDHVKNMRREVIGLIPSLVYADPRRSNVDYTDAFDLTLEGLLKKIAQEEDATKPDQPASLTTRISQRSNVR